MQLLLPLLLAHLAARLASGAAAEAGAAWDGQSCFLCPWMDELPLDDWTAQRNETVVERLPWGEEYELHPVDYQEIGLALCECVMQATEGQLGPTPDFVQVESPQLMLRGEPFYFTGFNAAQAVAWAANITRFLDDLELLFASAAEWGLQVGRVWAHANGWDVMPPTNRRWDEMPRLVMQIEPGRYNEAALQAVDLVIATAARHEIRLVVTLADYHNRFGSGQAGIEPYMQWVLGRYNLTGSTVLDFYTDERAKLLFKANMCHMATRVNSLTGVPYRDDPTIAAWDLLNEPRCPACPGATHSEVVAGWVAEMSEFLHCIDPNHLVSVGTEGYFGETDSDQLLLANPGAWVLCEGASWNELGAAPHIDVTVAHMYQSMRGSWDEVTKETCGFDCAMRWYSAWLQAHINASSKPFVLEEFMQPYNQTQRDLMFGLVRSIMAGAREADRRSPAAGAMFWGATVGAQLDWDGYSLFLDGSLPRPAPEEEAALVKEHMPAEEKDWLNAIQVMQASFRRQETVSQCYEEVKQRYAYLYDTPELDPTRIYNSTPTLRIVERMAEEATASRQRGGPG